LSCRASTCRGARVYFYVTAVAMNQEAFLQRKFALYLLTHFSVQRLQGEVRNWRFRGMWQQSLLGFQIVSVFTGENERGQ
jgi:hypothetical protein